MLLLRICQLHPLKFFEVKRLKVGYILKLMGIEFLYGLMNHILRRRIDLCSKLSRKMNKRLDFCSSISYKEYFVTFIFLKGALI